MSDHLPECPAPLCDWGYSNAECMGYEDCHHLCVCDALRACEQRVRQETFDADWSEMGQLAAVQIFRRQAYRDALDAAREAVDRLASDMANWSSAETAAATEATPDLTADQWMWAQRGVHRSLAAIDALRGER